MNKTKATPEEIQATQDLAKVLVTIATSNSPAVGMTGLIMATAVAATALDIPLENICALFDQTASEVYEVHQGMKV